MDKIIRKRRFKIGDQVRAIGKIWTGYHGTVTDRHWLGYTYTVRLDYGAFRVQFSPDELEPVGQKLGEVRGDDRFRKRGSKENR